MGGEEEAVGVQPVVGPFAVDPEILDRGFDLDDPDVALPGQRDEVGAAAGGQRQFGQHMRAHFHQQPLHAAPHQHGAFGLATVDEGVEGNRRDDRHGGTMPDFVHGLNPFSAAIIWLTVKGLPFALSRLSKVATRLGLIYIISSLIVAPWLSVLLLTLGLSENATLAS